MPEDVTPEIVESLKWLAFYRAWLAGWAKARGDNLDDPPSQSVRVFNWFWNGAYRKGESCPQVPMPALHPAQKPVALMQWIIGTFTTPHQVVFDPYMGSGPVAQACANLGRKYIGCEVEESYCEAAVGRLAQAAFDLGGVA